MILLSAAALGLGILFFLHEESSDYYKEITVQTSDTAETWVSFTESTGGSLYLMLPESEGGSSDFIFDEDLQAEIDGESVRSGDSAASLEEGTHTLTVRKSGNPFPCTVTFTLCRESSLPCIYLDFPSGSLYKISQEKGKEEKAMMIAMTASGSEDTAESCSVKVHGNTSWYNDKKSLDLHFDEDVSLLGMSAQEKWLLISNYSDLSSLKNYSMYLTQTKLGVTFAPECCFVSVYVNGTYEGLYLLVQKIDGSGGTVKTRDLETENELANSTAEDNPDYADTFSIDENGLNEKGLDLANTPSDISGGYLMELCGSLSYEDRDAGFTTPHRFVVIRTPNNATRSEVSHIASFVREAEEALYGGENHSELWTRYFDRTSWIQQYLLQEFSLNNDTELNSEFFWTDGEEDLLHGGPGWDYDLSFSSITDDISYDLQSLHVEGLKEDGNLETGLLWLPRMNEEEDFHEALKQYFTSTMAPVLREVIEQDLPEAADTIAQASRMDSLIWHNGGDTEGAADTLLSEMAARLSFLSDYYSDESSYVKLTFTAPEGRFDLVLAVREGTVLETLPTVSGCSSWKDSEGNAVEGPLTASEDLVLYPDEEEP